MSNYDIAERKSIAREHATDDPDHIGRDQAGADHFWSMYDQTVIVVNRHATDTCDLGGVERPLDHWRRHTESERGWDWHSITDEPLLAVV